MRAIRGIAAAAIVALGVASCYAPAGADKPEGVTDRGTTAGRSGVTGDVPVLPDVPVDLALQAISRAGMNQDAAAAWELCVAGQDEKAVVGMAQVPAGDVGKYMMTGGKDPEFTGSELVWFVQLEGEITYRWGTFFNPVCIVQGGMSSIYGPYGGRNRDGKAWYPPEDYVPPTLAVPTLAP